MGAPVRKADHLRLAARADVLHLAGPGLEHLRLRHRAPPGRDLDDVELGCELLGRIATWAAGAASPAALGPEHLR